MNQPWYQCDEENYNSGEPPEEQTEYYTFACICGWRKTLHVNDLQASYEKPFAPCGHDWEWLECVG